MNHKDILSSWQKQEDHSAYPDPDQISSVVSKENLEKWLIAWLCKKLKMNPSEIDTSKSIMSYGLDSMGAVELERDVQVKFKIEISLSDFFENNSIAELVSIGMEEKV
ncbi:MAG: acyl carrier protein [Bacteroidota bacterium]|nr:acyl carrier protein [Bacteroidota bacterium]